MNRREFIKLGFGTILGLNFDKFVNSQISDDFIFCGWIPPSHRTIEQKRRHDDIIARMPEFKIIGHDRSRDATTSRIWDCSKVLNGNKHLKCFNQNVGSCVGQGLAKALWYLQFCQNVISLTRETPILPYEPYGYAQSRVCAGISGNGDGSTGAGGAEAAKTYGVLRSDLTGLPRWGDDGNTIDWPGNTDKEWGRRGAPEQHIQEGKRHLVRTTALVKTPSEVVAALTNGYPITCASMWGGMMNPPIRGNPPVRLNRRVTQWAHQMMISNFYRHPELGLLFYIQNSWGAETHGTPPDDAPKGGFWIQENELNYILRENESFAFSFLNGFPAQDLDKALFDLISYLRFNPLLK